MGKIDGPDPPRLLGRSSVRRRNTARTGRFAPCAATWAHLCRGCAARADDAARAIPRSAGSCLGAEARVHGNGFIVELGLEGHDAPAQLGEDAMTDAAPY